MTDVQWLAALAGALAGGGLMLAVQLLVMRHEAREWAKMVERHESRASRRDSI